MFGKSKENPMEKEDTKTKKTLKSKTKSNVINTNPQLPGVNEQGSAVAKKQVIEKVLSLSQRRQRALVMRKNEPKLERARKLAKNKFAGERNLKARAEKAAIAAVRRKFAGQRGIEYATLSPSDKIMVDKLIDKKTALIKKIAVRLYPKIRKAETERMASLHTKSALGGAADVKKGALGASPLMQSVDMRGLVDAMLTEEMNAKMDKLLRMGLGDKDKLNQYRQALQDPDKAGKYVVLRKHLITMLDKLSKLVTDDPTMFQKSQAKLQKQRDYPSDKVAESLQQKSQKSGIAVSTLAEVFNRGYSAWDKSKKCNAEQYAFARVNSFISGGKAYELDIDLVSEKKDPCWKGYKMVGMKKKKGRPVPNCVPEETNLDEHSPTNWQITQAANRADKALDKKYKYGTTKGGISPIAGRRKQQGFGAQANFNSAEAGLNARGNIRAKADAVHRGWGKTVNQMPAADAKKQAAREKLKKTPFFKLAKDEQEKDVVLAKSLKKEETSVETKPKLKDKIVKREIYTIQLKGADPQSMPEETMVKKLKKALKKC